MSYLIKRALLWRSRKKIQVAMWLAERASANLDRILADLNKTYVAGSLFIVLLTLMR